MKKSLQYAAVFFILVASSTMYVPPAQAVGYDSWRIYYDGSFSEVGWWNRNCSHQISSSGTQDGVWKEEVENECFPPGGSTSTYYQKCYGDWLQVGYLGDEVC